MKDLSNAGRVLGRLGGVARFRSLTPERRREIGAMGGRARAQSLSAQRRQEIARLGGHGGKGKKKYRRAKVLPV